MITMRVAQLKIRIFVLLGLAVTLLLSQPVFAEETAADDWQFSATLYGWAPNMKGKTANDESFTITIKDIIEDLNFTLMGSVGVRKNKWNFATDVIYMDIEKSWQARPQRILSLTDVSLKAWIVTPRVGYTVVQSDWARLDLLAGARYLYLETDLSLKTSLPISPNSRTVSESGHAWNGIVGLKGQLAIDEHWKLPFYFDVGTGESQLTWQAFGGIAYAFTNFDVVVGYRHLRYSFDDSDTFGKVFNSLHVTGPMAGVRYRF